MDHYVVVCRADAPEREEVIATRRLFASRLEADRYASTVHPSRAARIMPVGDYLITFEGWRSA